MQLAGLQNATQEQSELCINNPAPVTSEASTSTSGLTSHLGGVHAQSLQLVLPVIAVQQVGLDHRLVSEGDARCSSLLRLTVSSLCCPQTPPDMLHRDQGEDGVPDNQQA